MRDSIHRTLLPWALWLFVSLVIVGAFYYAPAAQGFIGESSRILFFHVPMAITSFVAFMTAGVWSVRFLAGGRRPIDDRRAHAAIELGLLFGLLASVTGALWAKVEWGAYWNWDPRQTSIVFALVFYAAYLALRGSVVDEQTRRRLASAYGALGLVVAPFLFFVAPRLVFSLHPQPLVNASGEIEMSSRILQVLLASVAGFVALFFWLLSTRRRVLGLEEAEIRSIDA